MPPCCAGPSTPRSCATGFNFLNIGYYLERGDSTARLMDVKYYVLLPRVDFVGSGLDNYQWTTLLRAMGAQRAFHWAYGGEVTAMKIADFLIRNPQSPRSLATCTAGLMNHLGRLAKAYGRETEAQDSAQALPPGSNPPLSRRSSRKACTNS
jgi:uncharacterized alpha-E superfamily protein